MNKPLSVENLLADAKSLVEKLQSHDSAADKLNEQAVQLQTGIEARNAYMENLKELNKAAGHKPRSTLIQELQQENCVIRSLQDENSELRQNLIDYQTALDWIMTKYRHQKTKFMNDKNFSQTLTSPLHSFDETMVNKGVLTEKIDEMAAVMQRAIHTDEDDFTKRNEYISTLKAENYRLRDLLLINEDQFMHNTKDERISFEQKSEEKNLTTNDPINTVDDLA